MEERTLDDTASDVAFENWLLDSGRSEPLPLAATEEAWLKFARGAGVVAVVSAGGTTAWARAVRAAGARWAILGAVAGSAATAAWMTSHRPVATAPPVAALERKPPSTPVVRVELRPHTTPAEAREVPPSTPTAALERALKYRDGHAVERHPSRTMAPSPALAATENSTLAAEVSAIDAVRTAIAVGDYPSAVHQVDEYHRAFPKGELSPDAEVLAIEALAEGGKRDEARRRAKIFLGRYPADPHAARIAALSP